MNPEYFVDTGGFYALIDSSDPDHGQAVRFFAQVSPSQIVTTNYIFDEAVTLSQSHLGHSYALKLGRAMRSEESCFLVYLDEEIERQAWALFEKRKDKDYSFTDCTSFIFCRKKGISRVLSFDKHFTQQGFMRVEL